MESTTPLLNEYKLDFFWKRLPQTVLGGVKLKFGFPVPPYIYTSQLILFVLPWLISAVFTILAQYNLLDQVLAACLYGGLQTAVVLALQVTSVILDRRKDSVAGLTVQNNLLSEDDEVEFESCCGAETFLFLIPRKKYIANIVIHALVSGVIGGLGLLYLLPLTLDTLYGSTGATVTIFIFGWLVLCIAQYPLMTGAPPEPATYRTSDILELMCLLRPFYVLLFLLVDLIARFEASFTLANQVLHIVYVFLPVFWTVGLLPPLDTVILWAVEQILVHGYGGSPMATDLRLLLMVITSTVLFTAALFIKSTLAVVVMLACTGYILSTDVGYLGAQLLERCTKNTDSQLQPKAGFLWSFGWREMMYHATMVVLIGGVAFVVQYFTTSLPSDLVSYLGYVVLAVFVVEHSCTRWQSVYVTFGFFRNRFYPKSIQRTTIFRKRKKLLAVFGWIRRLCINWVGPFTMLTYLSAAITSLDNSQPATVANSTNSTPSVTNDFLVVLGSTRALRWIWQDTSHCLLEITVIHLRGLIYPNDPIATSLHISVFLLLVGVCRDRAFQLYNKLYFYFVVLVTSYSDKKQRRKSSAGLIGVSVLLLPVVIAVIVGSVILSAPVLTLFTLPVVMIGFPRPERFWPGAVGSSANICADTMFYSHLTQPLCRALKKAMAFGSLGTTDPGNHYLARLQDRMVWLSILERGHGYTTVSVKGLELQETSCHTAEAARIDDLFDHAFEQQDRASCCRVNPYPLHTLTPIDAIEIQTYSDARNVLTGIIDSPDNLQILNKSFIKCLVWVLLQHTVDMKARKTDNGIVLNTPVKSRSVLSVKSPHTITTVSTRLTGSGTTNPLVHPVDVVDSVLSRPSTAKSRLSRHSMSSLGDWSDDNESLALEPITNLNKPKINLLAGLNSRNGTVEDDYQTTRQDVGSKRTPAGNLALPGSMTDHYDDTDDLIDELDFGLPAMDINHQRVSRSTAIKSNVNKSNNIYQPVTNLAGSMQFTSPYSSRLSLPLKWREIPIEQSQINAIVGQFPREWFDHVLNTLDLSVNGRSSSLIATEIGSDDVLVGIYAQITMACYAIVNMLGIGGGDVVSLGASHVFKVYNGDVPWSVSSDWLTEDDELMAVVLKAYRYAVKMMIDQAIMGEATSNEEVQEYLEDYDSSVYIGLETDTQWRQAMEHNTPLMFALGYDSITGNYSSRVLTLTDLPVPVGRVNKESVESQWANLSLELLYFTNDDEERYSIQAHPTILRNLTVQAADPPLGYPIFASPPISIPTL